MPLPVPGNPIGEPFIELQSIDSTNKYAMGIVHGEILPEGQDEPQHGMAIFAHEQTSGKGQRGKIWTSQKGANIALSILLNPFPLNLTEQFQLSVCIAVSVQQFFSNYAGNDTKIKWPNDLYWRDRKAGGVLIENVIGSRKSEDGSQKSEVDLSDLRPQTSDFGPQTSDLRPQTSDFSSLNSDLRPQTSDLGPQTSAWKWAVVGIGININQTVFSKELLNPVSLKQITGKDYSPLALARELCSGIEKNYQILKDGRFEGLFDIYQTLLYKKSEHVKLKKGNRVFETTLKGVSRTGQLITQHSIEEKFEFGEVEWVK